MKEIKAFVRSSRIDEVVRALSAAEAPGLSVSRVHGLGYGCRPYEFTFTQSEVARAPEIVKVEIVCGDREVDDLVAAVVAAARTGLCGDGIIFVTEVRRVVRIRTGETGARALAISSQEPTE